MTSSADFDREAVHAELERVRADFHSLLEGADSAALARRTDGTRWSNEELLFHMLLGYLIVRTLRPLVRAVAHLPLRAGRAYARVLDVTTKPFDQINYVGSVIGARVFNHRRMGAQLDRTMAALHRALDRETEESLAVSMPFPTRWDPFFHDTMTIADLYRYGTRHYDFHRDQLTLATEGD
jgi:hypothetical protein